MEDDNRGLTSTVGPVEVDWPQTMGYYGGIAAAVAAGLIELPLGVFIAAIPFIKMFSNPSAPLPVRFVSQMMDGASKPVGGDGDASVRLVHKPGSRTGIVGTLSRETGSIWADARSIARGNGNRTR